MKDLDLKIFPPSDKKKWTQLAEKQLKGASIEDHLQWSNDAGFRLDAYYDSSDTKKLKYLEDFFGSLPSHQWKLYERVAISNEQEANEQALKALMGGCDGVIFSSSGHSSLNISKLLDGINQAICDVSILNVESDAKGNMLTDSNTAFESEVFQSPVSQISDLIKKVTSKKHIHRTAFSDFYLEIAAIRALRFLLEKNGKPDTHIHTEISLHNSSEHQWFLNTTAGLASILGGSHSIDLPTSIGDPRISRNTGNLIREESGIERYEDQCGGSYYVEILTDKIITGVNENKNR